VAKIIDKTRKKEQIVNLSDPESDGDVRKGYTNIKSESHYPFNKFQTIKREIYYMKLEHQVQANRITP
jgi:hypothetical protein